MSPSHLAKKPPISVQICAEISKPATARNAVGPTNHVTATAELSRQMRTLDTGTLVDRPLLGTGIGSSSVAGQRKEKAS